ncbi:hypothetical protein ACHAWF_015081 [Thalassiosira exigua]
MAVPTSSPPNLLALVLDATTSTWSHRDLARTAKDKALASKNKPSAGPATLDDVVTSALALSASFACLGRDNVLVVVAATEEEACVIYPRKGGEGNMEQAVMGGSGGGGGGGAEGGGGGERGERVDLGLLNDYVRLGVAELANRAAAKAEVRAERERSGDPMPPLKKGAAIAAALSLALCTINRFMVASHAGVSALADASMARRRDDEGILALMGGGGDGASSSRDASRSGLLRPRALVIQASPDRTSDYNALMNCAFAANKSEVVVDGCFVPSGMKDDDKSSPFLQQVVDQTGGVYLSVPGGAAQVGGALTEVLMTAFLPPPGIRGSMNLPRLHDVDFRARCFETGESVDVAQICNQCLSIFKERPKESCPTCGARVRTRTKNKKTKLN